MKILVLLTLSFCVSVMAIAQAKYTHSHNDYANNTPFYKAFYNGYNSIEADIFLIDGKVLVAHDKKTLYPERTLKELYLDPIIYAFQKDTSRKLNLLIDVKDDYTKTLPALIKQLKPLTIYLMGKDHPGRLKILISGNRPVPSDYKKYPDYLFFDDDLVYPHNQPQWDRVGQVSLNFENWSKWKGVGAIPDADKQRVKTTIDSVHTHTGKLVRFWGTPDTLESWQTQIDCGADIIGTDRIAELTAFLVKQSISQPATAIIPVVVKNNQ